MSKDKEENKEEVTQTLTTSPAEKKAIRYKRLGGTEVKIRKGRSLSEKINGGRMPVGSYSIFLCGKLT